MTAIISAFVKLPWGPESDRLMMIGLSGSLLVGLTTRQQSCGGKSACGGVRVGV
jgi:hypothetical protein